MTQKIYQHTFENGLTLLGEEMPWLESAAFAFLVRSGAIHDPVDRLGLSNLTCDMVQRGAGVLSNRQFAEALDRLGVDRSASVSLVHSSYSGASLAENLLPTITLYSDLLRQPLLPESQLEESRQVCFQELRAAEDDLAHRTMERVRQLQYPAPWGRSVQGVTEHVEAVTMDDVRDHYQQNYHAQNAIISVAGKIDWPRVKDHVEKLFGDWQPLPCTEQTEPAAEAKHSHIPFDANQTHLAIAYPSVPYRHEDYYLARAAVGVLSDGMSSRLFREVREQKGLCYTVYASLNTLRDQGCVTCYSATSTDRAQETLDTILVELNRLKEGIEETELQRLKARIKSSLIMQQESSSARAISMAVDWYHLGQVRDIAEVAESINALTADGISDYVRRDPPRDFKVASLGSEPLEVTT